MKQMIWDSEQLGRSILWGTVFFSIWFTDFELEGGAALVLLMLYFLFGGLFLDSMKRLWAYKEVRSSKQGSKK